MTSLNAPEPCRLCEWLRRETEPVYRGPHFSLVYDEQPISPGHMLLVSHRHRSALAQLTADEWAEIPALLGRARQTIETTDLRQYYLGKFGDLRQSRARPFYRQMLVHIGLDRAPDGYAYQITDGVTAGQAVAHFQLQIIPHYPGERTPHRGLPPTLPAEGVVD